jgi:hypothetical protein
VFNGGVESTDSKRGKREEGVKRESEGHTKIKVGEEERENLINVNWSFTTCIVFGFTN